MEDSSTMTRPTPGPLLATGRSADVYAAGPGRVLRRYRDPHADADFEARVMGHVHGHGYPVPEVFDVDGPDLVMERLVGPTMLEVLSRRPWQIGHHAEMLADLHDRLHRIAAPDWVPEAFGGPAALLHLDLHPMNVVMSPDGPVVIDWPNTRRGPALADVAHTWLVLGTARPDGPVTRLLATVARRVLVRRFLARYPGDEVRRILPAVAERWLADRNITDAERIATARLLERNQPEAT